MGTGSGRAAKAASKGGAARGSARRAPAAPLWHLGVIAVLALAVYLPTLGMGFVWDDEPLVIANPLITSLANVPVIFHSHAFAGLGRSFEKGLLLEYYRPVWISTLALDHSIWGLRALGYHLTNVLLNVVVSLLVYLTALRLLRNRAAALVAGALFAATPVHAEAVAWISGRNELLTTLFTLAAFLAYVRFRHRGGAWAAAGTLVAYWLALLSKESALVLPALALLYEAHARLGSLRQRLAGPLALALATVPYLLLRASMVTPVQRPDDLPLVLRLVNAPRILLEYVRLMVLPTDLRVLYRLPVERSPASLPALFAALGIALLVAFVVWVHRRNRGTAFGLGWVLVALVPVSGLAVTLHPAPVADRYLYLPSVGACVAAGAVVAWLATGRGKAAQGAVFGLSALVAIVLSVAAVARSQTWRDNRTFMSRLIADAPEEATGWFNRGLIELGTGRLEGARLDFQRAARLTPSDPRVHLHLAEIHVQEGRDDQARASLRTALELRPEYPQAHALLGQVEYGAGRYEEAADAFERALASDPDDLDAHLGLGAVWQSLGRYDAAEREYREVLAREADNAPARQNLGSLLNVLGRPDEAVRELRRATAIAPRDPRSHYNLGVVLQAQARYAEAESSFRAAVALDSTMAGAHNNLGVVLWRQERRDEALKAVRAAIRLAPEVATYRQNLDLILQTAGPREP